MRQPSVSHYLSHCVNTLNLSKHCLSVHPQLVSNINTGPTIGVSLFVKLMEDRTRFQKHVLKWSFCSFVW